MKKYINKHIDRLKAIEGFEAVAMMVGAIIGAGVLGIPYVVAQSGFIFGAIYILGLGVVVTYVHLMIGETTLRTKEKMQVPGLGRKYLGKVGGLILGLDFMFFSYMAILAYIIGFGDVLSTVFPILSEMSWSLVIFGILAFIVYVGLDGVKIAELFLSIFLCALFVFIIICGIPHIDFENLIFVQYANVFLPFGVIMFAMGGASAIPELENILPRAGRRIEKTLIIGTTIPMFLYFLFAIIVVGTTGLNTTELATIGLGNAIGKYMIVLGSVFAIIAMSTSFLTIGLAIRRVYEWDLKLPKITAWILAMSVPLCFYLIGARDFIKTLGLAGAIGGGIEGILFVLMFWKSRKIGDQDSRGLYVHYGKTVGVIVIAVFVFGIVATLFLV